MTNSKAIDLTLEMGDLMVVIYFSGTGNTQFAAKYFAGCMKCPAYSIEQKVDFDGILNQNETVAFFYPVYCSDVSMIMRRFIDTYRRQLSGKQMIIYCTQMVFSGDGARRFTDLLEGINHKVIYARHLMMPNNISNLPVLSVNNHPKIDRRIKKVKKRIRRDVKAICNQQSRRQGFNVVSKYLGFLTQRAYLGPLEKKAQKDVRIRETCIQCGLCVRRCPMRNLKMSENGVQQKGVCTLCYRCVNLCPEKAITVLIHHEVKEQYKGI